MQKNLINSMSFLLAIIMLVGTLSGTGLCYAVYANEEETAEESADTDGEGETDTDETDISINTLSTDTEYDYEMKVVNPYCEIYTMVTNRTSYYYCPGILIYVKTDNPDPTSITFGFENSGGGSASYETFAIGQFIDDIGISALYNYYARLRDESAATTIYSQRSIAVLEDGSGYLYAITVENPGEVTIYLEEDTKKADIDPLTVYVRDYDEAYDQWVDSIIENAELDDSMTNEEKMEVLCDYILENYHYLTNVDGESVLLYSEYGTSWQNMSLDSRTSPELLVALAEKIGYEGIEMCSTNSSNPLHSYVTDGTNYYTACNDMESGAIDLDTIETISLDEVTARTGYHEYSGSGTVTKAASGSSAGEITYTCSECGNTYVGSTNISEGTVTLSKTSYTYNGSVKKPTPAVTLSENITLEEGTDYTVTYSSGCKNAGTYTVTVTGKGIYTGAASKTFTISAQSLSSSRVTLSKTSYTYNGSARKPSVTVTNSSGATLTKDTDYTVKYSTGCKNAGTYTVRVTGTGNYTGTVKKTFKINAKSISGATITLAYTSCTYDGSVHRPVVTSVVLDGITLTEGTDYDSSYSSIEGVKIGSHTVYVEGMGNYCGETTTTYKIVPKKVTVSSVKSSAAGKLTVKWSKVSGSVSGYQIRYKKSTSSTWTTVTVKTSTLSKTISNLTAGKKYTVQVRAYETSGGKKYYGSWSSTKTVTVKKAQTLTVKSSSSKTVSYTKVKKAKRTVKVISKVSGAKGKVTYTKSSGSKYLSVSKTTGKITVKKGAPRGMHRINIKVKSAATSTYASASKTITVWIIVI